MVYPRLHVNMGLQVLYYWKDFTDARTLPANFHMSAVLLTSSCLALEYEEPESTSEME